MTEDRHPMDVMAEVCEIDADDPSGWSPETHVEHKYGTLFIVEDPGEYQDIADVEGTFYHIKPALISVIKEFGPRGKKTPAEDQLCINFSVYTKFVYHSDDSLCRSLAEITIELLNGNSDSIHVFDELPLAEWDCWPEQLELKTWIVERCNKFLARWKHIHPVIIDDVQHSLHRHEDERDWDITEE